MAGKTFSTGWTQGFWECFTPIDTCLMAWCCPCILFGKTQARIKDASLTNYSPINDDCLVWCGLNCCAASYLVRTFRRTQMRKKFDITETQLEELLKMDKGHIKAKYEVDGVVVEDLLATFFCPCCSLVQEEKEVLHRQQQGQTAGYKKQDAMAYNSQV